jgi:hypothetical protein
MVVRRDRNRQLKPFLHERSNIQSRASLQDLRCVLHNKINPLIVSVKIQERSRGLKLVGWWGRVYQYFGCESKMVAEPPTTLGSINPI